MCRDAQFGRLGYLEIRKEINHPLTPSFAGGGTRGRVLDGFH